MGYQTEFAGAFKFSRQLTLDENETLKEFAQRDHRCKVDEGMPPVPDWPFCNWGPTNRGRALHWNGGEKFYYYVEWLNYLIDRFFQPWDLEISGEVTWQGEDSSDRGLIRVSEAGVDVFSVQDTPCEECAGTGLRGTKLVPQKAGGR